MSRSLIFESLIFSSRTFVLSVLLALLPAVVAASPGAHGPNGEHLDGPTGAGAAVSDGRPRIEAYTELFELVAHVEHDAVTAMINRYETNEPVDGAEVELEADKRKVKAAFDAATGVYRFADHELAEALAKPGEHALVFTVSKGDDLDLVTGTLHVVAGTHAQGRPWWKTALTVLAALAVLAFLLIVVLPRVLARRSASPSNAFGGRR